MRLIDADKLMRDLKEKAENEYLEHRDYLIAIDYALTIDAEPVRHGKWVEDKKKYDPYVTCSLCGLKIYGARMERSI